MTPPPPLEDYRRLIHSPDAVVGGMRGKDSASLNSPAPLISIVTAVRNRRTTLPRTIESVLTQNFNNVEHVIVDGASTDGTVDVLKAYDDRLAFWISEPDGGLFDAMNRGVVLSRGEYIALLNSDDYYAPGALSAVAATIAATQADVVFGDYIFVVDDIGMQKRIAATTQLNTGMSLGHAIFIHRRVYERLGLYDARLRYSADLDFALRMKNGGVTFAHVADGPALQYFSNGGAAEQHLASASWEATRALYREAGFAAGSIYGLKAARRVLSRGLLGIYGAVLGRAAFLRAKARYYRSVGYTATPPLSRP